MAPTTPSLSASPFLSSRTLSPDLSGLEGSTFTIHAPSVLYSSRVAITASLRSKVHAVREHAAWSFRRIVHEIGVATSTLFSICSSSITNQKPKSGQPKLLTTPIRKRLIDFATASQANRLLSLTEIAEQAGVQASIVTLRNAFSTEGYHRCIAWVRPFSLRRLREHGLTGPPTTLTGPRQIGIRSSGVMSQHLMWEDYHLVVKYGLHGRLEKQIWKTVWFRGSASYKLLWSGHVSKEFIKDR